MQVAQKLYENGFITYMRTDSTTLSETAVAAARAQVTQLYGADYLPDKPRVYTGKVKNAQEAHEAIRPSGDRFRTPAETGLTGDQFRLYELIWKRTVASQMKDAVGQSVTVKVGGRASDGRDAEFTASGKIITFHGFLKAYVEGADDPNAELDDRERRLPQVAEGDRAHRARSSPPTATPPSPRPATPRRRWSRSWRSARSAARPRTPRSSARSSTAATSSRRARRWCRPSWLRRGQPAGEALRPPRRLRLHRQDGGRPRPHRRAARPSPCRGCAASTSARRDGVDGATARPPTPGNGDGDHLGGLKELVTDLGAIDAREISSFPVGEGIMLRVGRYGPYVERPRRPRASPASAPTSPTTAAGRADRRAGRGAARQAERRLRAGHRPGDRAPDRRQGRALRAVRHRGAARGHPEDRQERRQAAHRLAASSRCPWTR